MLLKIENEVMLWGDVAKNRENGVMLLKIENG